MTDQNYLQQKKKKIYNLMLESQLLRLFIDCSRIDEDGAIVRSSREGTKGNEIATFCGLALEHSFNFSSSVLPFFIVRQLRTQSHRGAHARPAYHNVSK